MGGGKHGDHSVAGGGRRRHCPVEQAEPTEAEKLLGHGLAEPAPRPGRHDDRPHRIHTPRTVSARGSNWRWFTGTQRKSNARTVAPVGPSIWRSFTGTQ